jgi:hypothetical protein
MKRMTKIQAILRVSLAILFIGTTFQAGCLGTLMRNFNPCGTIIECDPLEYDYLAYGLPENAPDWDLDPTCTLPGFCGPVPFPFGGSGTAGTGTTTGTGTTGGGYYRFSLVVA